MSDFAARVEAVSISGIREVFEAAGKDAINLGLGQPDFPTPDHVRRGAIEAIETGQTDAYTTNKGIEPLRTEIAAKYDREYGVDVDPGDIIATSGASEALHIALQAHVDPGDEVIIPDPGFVSYDALTTIAGGVTTPVPLRDDLTLDPQTVEDAITDETAAFICNTPANPTGAVQSEEDMKAFARIADEHDVLCLSDEVYEHIVFEGDHHTPLAYADSDNVVVVSACSKSYSMTGWRLGWIVASNPRIERMLRVHQYAQACASAPAQHAAIAALSGPHEPVIEMVETFERRRDIVVDGLTDAGLEVPTPKGAFYVMPRVPDGWCEEVLSRDVVVVPGDAFGEHGAGYARLSYATSTEELKTALESITEATRAVQ